MQPRRTGFFPFVLALATLAAMALCCVVLFAGYDRLVYWIINVLQKPPLEALIRNRAMPLHKFHSIQILCAAMLVLVPAGAYGLLKNRTRVTAGIRLLARSLTMALRAAADVFRSNTSYQNGAVAAVLLFLTLKSGYYILDRELQYDEMWCYNYFTGRPFYMTLFAYNNYPLFELSTQLTKWLPLPMKVNLRLPVLIMGLLSSLLLYACIRKWCRSHPVALGTMLVYGCMPVTTFYMLYARGVIFESFFAIAALFSLLCWLKGGAREWLVVFALSQAAGFYSMPTHLYYWGLLLLLGFAGARKRKRLAAPFLLANTAALLLAALLYVPVLIGSGFSFVQEGLARRYTYREIIPNIPDFCSYYSGYYTGFRWGMGCIGVITGLLWIRRQTSRLLLSLVVILCFLPLVLYVVQQMVVPFRAIGFVGLAVPLTFALAGQALAAADKTRFLWPGGVVIGALLVIGSHLHADMNWSRQNDKAAISLADLLIRYHVRNYYDNSTGSGFSYFYPALEYYYTRQGLPLDYYLPVRTSIRYRPFRVTDPYDCIIYKLRDSRIQLPDRYQPVFADSERNFQVLIRRK